MQKALICIDYELFQEKWDCHLIKATISHGNLQSSLGVMTIY